MRSVLLSALGAALLSQTTVLACDCAPPDSVEKAYKKSAAVFVGEIESGTVDKNNIFSGTKANFKITEDFKPGWLTKTVVETANHGAACGYGFQRGMKLLVYANVTERGTIATSICTRTKDAASATDEIDELRKLAKD